MTVPYMVQVDPDDTYRLLADTAATTGAFGLTYAVLGPRDAPPLHIHRGEDETVFVLEGRCSFHIADTRFEAGRGALVHAPRGLPHRFIVTSPFLTLLTLFTPGGFERFLSVMAAVADADPALMLSIAREHGCEILTPPL
jgi:mannose-6-phosphate isomerase-like protein (cupin superfamily)